MNSENKTSFFFIIGRARSGTTLLRTMFDAHPNVIIPLESPLIMQLNRKFGKVRTWNPENLLDFYNDVLNVKDFHKWEVNKDELKQRILSQPSDTCFKDLINLIYLSTQSFFPKKEIKLIGDKNPVYSISAKNVYKLYPEAKYIHLQRDYRAHILSMLNAGLYAKDIVALAYRWKYSAKILNKLKRYHPESFYSIKYEELVNNPEKHMTDICKFLGIEFTSDMINYHIKLNEKYKEIEEVIEEHHKRVFKPIDASRIDSWKTELTTYQIKTADYVVEEWADFEGYERVYKNPDLSARLMIFPAVMYQRIFYVYRYFYTKLPLFIRSIIG